jgi:hypothetical protein
LIRAKNKSKKDIIMKIAFGSISLSILLLLLLVSCNKEPSYTPDGHIFLKLYEPNKSLPDILPLLQNENPNLIAVFVMGDSAKHDRVVLGIARMKEEKAMNLEQAFNVFVKDVAPAQTRIVEAGSYTKGGRTLYRKISETDFGEYISLNVMYYFMENERSNIMYELKITGASDKKEFIVEQAEKMATSVYFKPTPENN